MEPTIKQSLKSKIWNLEEAIQNGGKPHIAELDKLTQEILKNCPGTKISLFEEGGKTLYAYSLNRKTITRLVNSYGALDYVSSVLNHIVRYVPDDSEISTITQVLDQIDEQNNPEEEHI